MAFVAWLYLSVGHGRFWRGGKHLKDCLPKSILTHWPTVVVVIPARNETEVIERTLQSLLDQDYPGKFYIVLVDDHSDDGTSQLAQRLAAQHPMGARLTVVTAEARPPGWMGKVWALHTGLQLADQLGEEVEYQYFTDADILHSPGNLREMVSKAETDHLDLVSLMVRLHCRHAWERLLIPSFVYFFQKLYPFPWINDSTSAVAGAAGGCILVRTNTLKRAGGLTAIRGEIIDDCALGKRVKKVGGKVWIGLTDTEHSIRPYDSLAAIWAMVARTAFSQLRYSLWILGATVIGLLLLYVIPPMIVLTWPLHGNTLAGTLAVFTWFLITVTFHPTVRNYNLPTAFSLAPHCGRVLSRHDC
jgi:hopene-associated glycosyltransferase HpnB